MALSILYNESTNIAIGTSWLTFLNFINSFHLKLDMINFEAGRLNLLICSTIILLVSSAVFSPLSSIFKNIFSGIISITSFSVGMDIPPTNFTFLI